MKTSLPLAALLGKVERSAQEGGRVARPAGRGVLHKDTPQEEGAGESPKGIKCSGSLETGKARTSRRGERRREPGRRQGAGGEGEGSPIEGKVQKSPRERAECRGWGVTGDHPRGKVQKRAPGGGGG